MKWLTAVLAAICWLGATAGFAQEQDSESKASFIFNGERVKIGRGNPDTVRFAATFAARATGCGARCIAPMQVAEGVPTLDETDVLAFLVGEVASNVGLMVDARMPRDRENGHIPGSVSLPHETLSIENVYRDEILVALGARELDGVLNFANVRQLLVYDTGPGTDDAGKLIHRLIEVGYPVGKLKYYRGGMQMWSVLGFSIDVSRL